jgi:hypothetical protein
MQSLADVNVELIGLMVRPDAFDEMTCTGCRGRLVTPLALLVMINLEPVCPRCVENYWGKAAAQVVEQLSSRYLANKRAAVCQNLLAAGEQLLAVHGSR